MQRGEPRFSRKAYGRPCAAVLPVIGALASPSPNAKYTAIDILNVALSQCRANGFVATTIEAMRCRGIKTMAGQRFLQLLGRRDPDDMLEICGDMPGAAVKTLAKAGRLKGSGCLPWTSTAYPTTARTGPTPRAARRRPVPTGSSAT